MTLPFHRKVGYASANYGKSLLWTSTEFFLLFFLTDIMGLSPAFAGMILLVSLIWDGITDPLMGFAADRLRHRLKGYSPYLFYGGPITVFFFVLLFYKPPLVTEYLGAYALIIGLLFRSFYSIIDVPHNSMMASLTRDSRERSTLASLRMLFSSIGGMTVSLGLYTVLKSGQEAQETRNFLILAVIIAVFSVITFYLCWAATHDIEEKAEQSTSVDMSIKEVLKAITQNIQLLTIFTLTAITCIATPIYAKTLIYYCKYALLHDDWSGVALLFMSGGQAVSLLFWTRLSHKNSKSSTLRLAHITLILALISFAAFPVSNLTHLNIISFLIGFSVGGVYMLNWAMMPDVIEYGEWQSGTRIEAGIIGLFTLINKVSLGVGAGLLGFFLASAGFKANAVQSSNFNTILKGAMFIIPIAGSLCCLAILPKYKLTHDYHKEISSKG